MIIEKLQNQSYYQLHFTMQKHKTEQMINHYFLSSTQRDNKKNINTNVVNCSMPLLKNNNKFTCLSPQSKLFSKNFDDSLFNTKSTICNKSAKTLKNQQPASQSYLTKTKKKNNIINEEKSLQSIEMKGGHLSSSEKSLGVLKLDKKASQTYYERRNRQLQEISQKLMYCKDFLTNRLPSPKSIKLQKSISSPGVSQKTTDSILNKRSTNLYSDIPSKEHFKVIKKLGRGKFGEVRLVIHKKLGFIAAMKILRKSFLVSSMMIKQLIHQIKIQTFIDHPNIVKLFCFFDDHENIYLLSQYLSDGHLYSYIQNNHNLSQKQVSKLMLNICSAVQELHRNQIIHRDLKLENMILQSGVVKICDFGWSVHNNQSRMRQTCCGTPLYISPQILLGSPYNQKADVWALGILTYQLIVKKLPFGIEKQSDLVNITKKEVRFPPQVSQQAKQFIKSMLIKNANQRANLQELLNSAFIKMSNNNQQFIMQ